MVQDKYGYELRTEIVYRFENVSGHKLSNKWGEEKYSELVHIFKNFKHRIQGV